MAFIAFCIAFLFFLFFSFFENAKIWVGRTTLNREREKKRDGPTPKKILTNFFASLSKMWT